MLHVPREFKPSLEDRTRELLWLMESESRHEGGFFDTFQTIIRLDLNDKKTDGLKPELLDS